MRLAGWFSISTLLTPAFTVLAIAETVAAAQSVRTAPEFVVIVNVSNSAHQLSRNEVAAYFLKRRATWPDGTGVIPVDLPPDARARAGFSKEVLRRAPRDVSAYWIQEIFAGRSDPPDIRNTDAAVLSFVAATPGAIGYVSVAQPTSTVRVLVISP